MLAALWALGFFAVLMALSHLVRPKRSSDPATTSAFSSGENPSGKPWIRMSARYHVLIAVAATFFLAVLLLFPSIATFKQWLVDGHGIAALTAVGMFLGTFAVALAYAWMKGDLSWISNVVTSEGNHGETNGNPGKRVS